MPSKCFSFTNWGGRFALIVGEKSTWIVPNRTVKNGADCNQIDKIKNPPNFFNIEGQGTFKERPE